MINNQALFLIVVLSFSIRLHGSQGKNYCQTFRARHEAKNDLAMSDRSWTKRVIIC